MVTQTEQRGLEVLTWPESLELLSRRVRESAPSGRPMDILEAGCGRQWELNVPLDGLRITGVDLDADALQARVDGPGDLDRAVVGDIRDPDTVEPDSFDVVYSSFVLEHVPGAEKALDNMVRWLRPGGLVILRVPDANSVYGFLARTTPHSFHIWVYRNLFRNKAAGTPGHGPYPTSYSRILTVKGMSDYCRERGLELDVVHATNGIGGMHGIRRYAAFSGMRIIALSSRGKLTDRHNDLSFVIRKPA